MTDRRPVAVITVHSCPFSEIGAAENGGMSVYVRSVTRGLSAKGIPTILFTRKDDVGSPPEMDLPENCRLVHIKAGPEAPLDKNEVFYHLPEFYSGVAEYVRCPEIEFRAVHSHYWLSGWVGNRLAHLLGVPWLHMAHTLAKVKDRDRPPGAEGETGQRVAVEEEIARDCNRMIAPTAQEREDLVNLYGAGRDCVSIIPPGVDLETFRPLDPAALRGRLGLAGDDHVVLFTGRLERLKGLETLIFAMSTIVRGGREDIKLLVLGADSTNGHNEALTFGGERGRLHALADDLDIADRVTFLGPVGHDQLPAYYNLADVCCVPSYSESFGLVALEAQACGTPVVASRVGGLRQLVLDGITGYTIPHHDPGAYAAALLRVIDDDSLRTVMGVAGRRLAEAYSWERTAERLFATYQDTEADYARAAEELLG